MLRCRSPTAFSRHLTGSPSSSSPRPFFGDSSISRSTAPTLLPATLCCRNYMMLNYKFFAFYRRNPTLRFSTRLRVVPIFQSGIRWPSTIRPSLMALSGSAAVSSIRTNLMTSSIRSLSRPRATSRTSSSTRLTSKIYIHPCSKPSI